VNTLPNNWYDTTAYDFMLFIVVLLEKKLCQNKTSHPFFDLT